MQVVLVTGIFVPNIAVSAGIYRCKPVIGIIFIFMIKAIGVPGLITYHIHFPAYQVVTVSGLFISVVVPPQPGNIISQCIHITVYVVAIMDGIGVIYTVVLLAV
ncbi:MAG: hypothetical protein BWY70_00572 [Bacteroidetes bacterium ADurb.Bin408]|nr:MAG: hypothetical protein BWY70_00572 [Bacteroidetes bacterium ADurb.Bin408]